MSVAQECEGIVPEEDKMIGRKARFDQTNSSYEVLREAADFKGNIQRMTPREGGVSPVDPLVLNALFNAAERAGVIGSREGKGVPVLLKKGACLDSQDSVLHDDAKLAVGYVVKKAQSALRQIEKEYGHSIPLTFSAF